MIALLLLEEARKRCEGRRFTEFSFRAMQPLFDVAPFRLCGRIDDTAVSMWAEAMDGSIAMQAHAQLDDG